MKKELFLILKKWDFLFLLRKRYSQNCIIRNSISYQSLIQKRSHDYEDWVIIDDPRNETGCKLAKLFLFFNMTS